MGLVKTCCGLWELKEGARNIAIISMIYDLVATAALLLLLLLYIPKLPWMEPPEENLLYRVLLYASITLRVLHMIPSFLLLYSTWEEIPFGVRSWLVFTSVDLLVHAAWLVVPFVQYRFWPLDRSAILVTFILLSLFIAVYFILVVSSYLTWVKDRDHDIRARRRLKEFY